MFKSTDRWTRYWSQRKCDWIQSYHSLVEHAHRDMVIKAMERFLPFRKVLELGCATGPNLIRVKRAWPWVQVGGVDVSSDAIAAAKKVIPDGMFDVRPAHSTYFDNKVADVTITDACLIYYSSKDIGKVLKEMARLTYSGICLVEFHSKSPLRRWALKLATGYNAYDYEKILTSAGFYDIEIKKIPTDVWPGMPWQEFGHVITAKCPYKV